MGKISFARALEGMIRLDDVLWGRVNSCRADRSVSCRVGGAALAGVHLIYYLLSTDIIVYFGGYGNTTDLRMDDNGRWYSACAMMSHIPPVAGPLFWPS